MGADILVKNDFRLGMDSFLLRPAFYKMLYLRNVRAGIEYVPKPVFVYGSHRNENGPFPQRRSCFPKHHTPLANPLGSRPSSSHLLFR